MLCEHCGIMDQGCREHEVKVAAPLNDPIFFRVTIQLCGRCATFLHRFVMTWLQAAQARSPSHD